MVEKESKQHFNSDCDIMIVGGGPAGISTWLHLHKYYPELTAKCVLIEKEKYPRDKLCGGAILNVGQEVLKQLNVHLDIPFVSIDNTEYRFGKEVFYHKERNFLQIIRRIEFDHMLVKVAIGRGLQLKQDEALLNLSQTKNDRITVETNKEKYNVKILIGADGATSKVRNKMHLPKKPRLAAALEIFAPVNPNYDKEFATNTAVMDFTPMTEGLQGYVWHFPCIKDGKPAMNHGICHAQINTEKKHPDLKTIFTQELKKRKISLVPSAWSGHPVPWLAEESPLSQSNILLVGDAAGIEPLIGGGIHLSLWYGEVAALSIIDAYDRNDFSFERYTDQIKSHILGKYIRRSIYLASEVYHDRMKILDVMQKITKR
jgi:flavin-dependent dehydrogenase